METSCLALEHPLSLMYSISVHKTTLGAQAVRPTLSTALIRRRYADLFNGADTMTNVSDLEMQQWMNPPSGREAAFWPRLNAFLFECWLSRALGMAL